MAGSLLMLAAVVAYGLQRGSFDLVGGASANIWIFLGFAAAFAVKAPLFPLHGWLPDAYRESPPEVAGVLSGIVSKAAAYGFFYIGIFHFGTGNGLQGPVHDLRMAILALAAISLVYGSLLAFRAPDIRGVIAYSSLAQMGLITLGLFATNIAGFNGAILQMVNHGLITGALFLLVGVIYERTHDRTIAKMGGLSARTPVYAAVFGFFVFASAGLPGLSGFVGEFLVLVGSFQFSPIVAAIATFAMILSAAYLLWMFQRVVTGDLSEFLAGLHDHLTDMRPVEVLTLAPLGALVVVFGLFPGLILDLVKGSVATVFDDASKGTAVAVPPIVPVAALAIIAAVIVARVLTVANRHAPDRALVPEPAAGSRR
jgi:NADH-quinone oxidoreductase subunit M